MLFLDCCAVETICGLAKMVVSFGTTESKATSESAWLRTAGISGILVIWAAARAIWAEDSWSNGFACELVVAVVPLIVLRRTVWLAERLVNTKTPTVINRVTLPVIMPHRISLRRERLLSFEGAGIADSVTRLFGSSVEMKSLTFGARSLRMFNPYVNNLSLDKTVLTI